MKTGAWGTDSSVLQTLADQGHELPARILEWRQLQKLKSTYADALVEQINPDTGRVHTSFAHGDRLDRAAVVDRSEPAEHPDPHRGRQPHPPRLHRRAGPCAGQSPTTRRSSCGCWRMSPTFPRCAKASRAARTSMRAPRSEVFGMPMEGMDPMTRRRAKAINFGIIYGISGFGLARQLGIAPGEARGYIDALFRALSRHPRLHGDRRRRKRGSTAIVTTPFGRRCWVPGIADKNPARRGLCRAAGDQRAAARRRRGHHQARDGAAARGAARGGPARRGMLLQVHDELLFEAPEDEAAQAGASSRAA